MTTIAMRSGVVASDSNIGLGGLKHPFGVQKLKRLDSGLIVGITGDYCWFEPFVEWFELGTPENRPNLQDSTILLFSATELTVFEGAGEFTLQLEEIPFAAWGSGAAPALGALHAGATAGEAVAIAALVDPGTGGAVHSLRIPEPKR